MQKSEKKWDSFCAIYVLPIHESVQEIMEHLGKHSDVYAVLNVYQGGATEYGYFRKDGTFACTANKDMPAVIQSFTFQNPMKWQDAMREAIWHVFIYVEAQNKKAAERLKVVHKHIHNGRPDKDKIEAALCKLDEKKYSETIK